MILTHPVFMYRQCMINNLLLLCNIVAHIYVVFSVQYAGTCTGLASFPGPTQLSIACSIQNNNGKLGGAWERGYIGPCQNSLITVGVLAVDDAQLTAQVQCSVKCIVQYM